MALEVACDTAVNGCVFMTRTADDDTDRLLRIAQEHVREQHGTAFSLEDIEARYVTAVEGTGVDT